MDLQEAHTRDTRDLQRRILAFWLDVLYEAG